MRIAIVNDVNAIAQVLAQTICAHTGHTICWTARDGTEAVARCQQDIPDLILMDLVMPNMDGVEATRRIMAKTPCAILIVTASVAGNAGQVFEAMAAGALDAVNTPQLRGSDTNSLAALLRKLTTIGKLIARNHALPAPKTEPNTAVCETGLPLIALGSSTGGPGALAHILSRLDSDLPAGVVVIQHVDPEFSAGMANWLDGQTDLKVCIAQPGDRPSRGKVLIAGTGDHLVVQRNGRLAYTPEPRDYVYRPSVNVFFESAAEHWRNKIVGVLLTGMGRDGANGLLALRQRGMPTIAQDQRTCAVWGMPKAAVALGAAQHVLPLDQIAAAIGRNILDSNQKQTCVTGIAT